MDESKTSTRTEQIYVFYRGRGWDPVNLAYAHGNLSLTVPRRYFHCGTFHELFCSGSLTNGFLLTIIKVKEIFS